MGIPRNESSPVGNVTWGSVYLLNVVAGTALILHFTRHLADTAAVIGAEGPWRPRTTGYGVFALANVVRTLPPWALKAAFAASLVAATGVAASLWARTCACILFVVSAAIDSSLAPFILADDQFCTLLCLGIAAMPAPPSNHHARSSWRKPVPGWAFKAFVFLCLFMYLQLGLSYVAGPIGVRLAFAAACAGIVLPGPIVATLVAPLVFGTLWYLFKAGSTTITCVTVLGTYVALLASRWTVPSNEWNGASPPLVDLRSAVAIAGVAIVWLNGTAAYVGAAPVAASTGAFLSLLGMPSPSNRLPAPVEPRSIDIVFEADESGATDVLEGTSSNARMQAVLRALDASSDDDSGGLRVEALRALARKHCLAQPRVEGATGVMSFRSQGKPEHPVGWFECAHDDEGAKLVVIKGRAPVSGGTSARRETTAA